MAFVATRTLNSETPGGLSRICRARSGDRSHARTLFSRLFSTERTERCPLLGTIASPDDLKRIPANQLTQLCKELRDYMIGSVQETGGHFSSPLGVVELTVALHRVFDSPKDRIVWDIGHQGYIHKMLTGRWNRLSTIRQTGGLSGFLRRYESEHDLFGAGHSSTSIGALQGIYEGDLVKQQHAGRSYVCVIGDGSLTGGMAMEALNYSATIKSPLIVIYNDNEQSSLPTGMPARHGTGPLVPYFMTDRSKKLCMDEKQAIAEIDQAMQHHHHDDKPIFVGPIDGHNIEHIAAVLNHLKGRMCQEDGKASRGPLVLHVKTVKGKGCEQALTALDRMHSVKGSAKPGATKAAQTPKTFTDVFADTLIELAERDKDVVAVTAGMPGSTGVGRMGMKYPERAFDVGIAEQHAVTFAAGMAVSGAKPFCCIYSTFMQRAVDQIIHDVSLQHLPVRFVVDRAGYVGEDGASHHGNYDIAYLRLMYNMIIMAPSNALELKMMTHIAYNTNEQPSAIRYQKGAVPSQEDLDRYFGYSKEEIDDPASMIKASKPFRARRLRTGASGVAILGFGPIVLDAMKAADSLQLDATVVDMRFLNPLDTDELDIQLKDHHTIVTAEDGVAGGFGSAVLEHLATRPADNIRVKCITYPKQFAHHGSVKDQKRRALMDVEGIAEQIRNFVAR